jgi:hypothetical protein
MYSAVVTGTGAAGAFSPQPVHPSRSAATKSKHHFLIRFNVINPFFFLYKQAESAPLGVSAYFLQEIISA